MQRNKVTIQDIAKSANVSKSTVSRVLNDNTPVNEKKRKAVLAAMKRLDYKPNVLAQSLAGGRSMTLGIVTQNIGSPFFDSVTQGVINALGGTSYSPIFADGRWDPEIETAAIDTLLARNVDGLIMLGGTLDGRQLEEICDSKPTVIVARSVEGWEDRCIAINNVEAAKTATQHLIESGHEKIAHIMGLESQADATDRYQGYCEALQEANIELDEQLVVSGDFRSQSGVLAVETLLLRNAQFTAIFSSNDEMAFGARLALYRRGIRVPDDVSIIGFDDQPSSAFVTPPLTTVAQPAKEMGAAGAQRLLGLIRQVEVESPELAATLIIRESVKHIVK